MFLWSSGPLATGAGHFVIPTLETAPPLPREPETPHIYSKEAGWCGFRGPSNMAFIGS